MAKRKLALIVALIVIVGSVVWFGRNVWRGLVPVIFPAPADIAKLIEQATSTAAGNTTGMPLKLPPGYSISIYAKGLGAPRDMLMLQDGWYLVSVPSSGKVFALQGDGKDERAEKMTEAISGLRKPHGLEARCRSMNDCLVYVAEENRVSEFTFDFEKRTLQFQKKLFDLPSGGGHTSRSLQFIPDGRLLVAIGSTCNVCNESDARRAKIMVWDGKELKEYAKGLRNSVFMALDGKGKIWATEMGRDLLGDDIPPDEINIIEEGKNYGWPNCYGKNIHDDAFDKNVYIRNPCMEPFETPSHIDLPAHSAPLGLTFFDGGLLLAFHGSWNRSVPTGYKIVRIKLDEKGNRIGMEDFISGWLTKDGKALGRPVDLVVDGSGALFITDDKAGVIYRVTPPR